MSASIFPIGVPHLKRIFDIVLALLLCLLLSPLILLIAILVRFFLGKPVIFRHSRPGYHAQLFTLYKFRSMTSRTDQLGSLLPDEQRLTPFGSFLRTTSLDELPELLNVLRGEMSLVGPRPLLTQYLTRYSTRQARRHEVLPGLTGWAQINGRNNVSWEDKFELDVWYVENWSIWLDLRILFLTPFKVLSREGISQPGNATAQEFLGSSEER